MEDFLFQTSGYIQQFFVGYDNTCIHFRRKHEDEGLYKDYFDMGYIKNNLSTDPIVAQNGMIECSRTNGMPVIKEYNKLLHQNSHPNETVSRNYITCWLNEISNNYNVDLSMCISIVGSNTKNDNNIFVAMSIMRFDLLLQKYLVQYIEQCKKIDTKYDVNEIFKLER